MIRFLLLLCCSFLLAACATTPPPLEQPGYLRVLKAKKIDPGTYARIAHGRVLGYDDLMALVRKGVPGKMIVPYLKATKTPYDYSPAEINGLINAGADSALVNYLGKAKGIYLQDGSNVPTHPYYTNPYYMGPAPFGFAYPDAWAGDFIGMY